MASAIVSRRGLSTLKSVVANLGLGASSRCYAAVAVGTDIVAAAPNVTLHKDLTWDVLSNCATITLKDLFKGKSVVIFGLPGSYTGPITRQQVPSYAKNIDKFRSKGIDSVICVCVHANPIDGWDEEIKAKIEFYGDFGGKFHKSLELDKYHSAAVTQLLYPIGPCNQRWSAYVSDGVVKVLNVEKDPREFNVSSADVILSQI